MKKLFGFTLSLIACSLLISSCKKADNTPIITPSSATIIFNDSITVQADLMHWDNYSAGVARMQAFKNNIAIITVWPGTVTTKTIDLSSQYLYWIITPPAVYTVNSSGGTITINNASGVLDGSLSATGNIWTGTGPAPTTIRATFNNVRQVGN